MTAPRRFDEDPELLGAPAAPAPPAFPRAVGISRLADDDRAIVICLERKPSDDELRAIHEWLRRSRT